MAPRMSPQEARQHIARLGITQQALARMIEVNDSTVRRWLRQDGDALDIPQAVAILLRILSPTRAKNLIAEAEADAD